MDRYQKEQLSNWVSDFLLTDAAKTFSTGMQEAGSFLLLELMDVAGHKGQADLQDIEEVHWGDALTELPAQYKLNQKVEEEWPAFAGAFFTDLEAQGRFGGGQALGKFLKTFSGRLGPQTVVRPGAKIGRNDPCPCGSGKKFKRCCQKEM